MKKRKFVIEIDDYKPYITEKELKGIINSYAGGVTVTNIEEIEDPPKDETVS